ncbi:hypothetical protein DDR33_16320 [Pararcticibacter amylolyticus]|uniref:DUF5683 domain-containing protein n=2 Tax=Pararcticibacter amylolyticus TaxID=2173175 RepID=A0A2U2PDZ9_9SPHI|nr:hypothetical protein DDR33_16320 [Pararcticibacter amylolyticus]
MPVFSQTDSTAVRIDSLVAAPVSAKPKIIAPKDTTAKDKNKQKQEKGGVVKDSVRLALEAMPKRAAWSSAIIPGWGQIRNGRWWKTPFIYGGLVSVGLAYNFNQGYYKKLVKELQVRWRADHNQPREGDVNNPDFAPFEDNALISAKDFYRRNRDLSILGLLAVHTINIIDAYVDAKFFRYDISDKLGFNVQPTLLPPASFASAPPVPALKLTIPL